MDLLLTAGLPWPTILYTILIDEVMIITGLIGALVQSSYKVLPTYLSWLLGNDANINSSGAISPLAVSHSYGLHGPSPGLPANTPQLWVLISRGPTLL